MRALPANPVASGTSLRFPVWFLVMLGTLVLPQAPSAGVATEDVDVLGRELDGATVRLSEYRGRAVVLAFWASWCSPCRTELPKLEAMQRLFGKDKVVVFAINSHEDAKAARRGLRSWGLKADMTVVLDKRGRLARKLGVRGVPATLLLGPQGELRWSASGYSRGAMDQLVREVHTVIKSAPPSAGAAQP